MYPITSTRSPNRKIWRLVSASKFSIAAADAPSGISLSNSKKRAEFSLKAAVSITAPAALSRLARFAARTCKPAKTSAPITVMVETRLRALAKSKCIGRHPSHQTSEDRSKKIRDQKSEIRNQKSDIRHLMITDHFYDRSDVIDGMLKFIQRRVDLLGIKIDKAQSI